MTAFTLLRAVPALLACAALCLPLQPPQRPPAQSSPPHSSPPHSSPPHSSPPQQEQPGPARSERWAYPVGSRLSVLDGFRRPPAPYAAGHRGIDLAAGPGHEIFAPAAGTVSFTGLVADRPLVSVRVGESLVYSIEPATSSYVVGDQVAREAPFAVVDRGGHCADSCVHLGVRLGEGDTERYVDPMRFLAPEPVLLPW